MAIYKVLERELSKKIIRSTEGVYRGQRNGDCWEVKTYEDRFYFEYLSGELIGKLKVIEITKDDYLLACSGDLSQSDLCLRFGVS